MTVSILRTADAWWVQTPSGAARIRTDAATTAELLADRPAIDAAADSTDTVPVENLSCFRRSRRPAAWWPRPPTTPRTCVTSDATPPRRR